MRWHEPRKLVGIYKYNLNYILLCKPGLGEVLIRNMTQSYKEYLLIQIMKRLDWPKASIHLPLHPGFGRLSAICLKSLALTPSCNADNQLYPPLGCSILINKITQLTALGEIYHLCLPFPHLFECISNHHLKENV